VTSTAADSIEPVDRPTPAAPPKRWEGVAPGIAASLAWCHTLTRSYARNFYYGLKLTPEPRRSAMYVVYAFMRECDRLADTEDVAATGDDDVERRAAALAGFREDMVRALPNGGPLPDGPLWPGFRELMRRYPIRTEQLHEMLDGQQMDLDAATYHTFDDLYRYCYHVASVVGLVSIEVWGYEGGEQTRQLAEWRGIALQLTNILRDVVEDARGGRVYLPADELAEHGLSLHSLADPADLLADHARRAGFERFMRSQLKRARGYYDRSQPLEPQIERACRPSCWALMRIYRGLLDQIDRDPLRVLRERVSLSPRAKAAIGLRAMAKRWL